MAKLSAREIKTLLQVMEARYAQDQDGHKERVGIRHPKVMTTTWRKKNGEWEFSPPRGSLLEAMWKTAEVREMMIVHVEKTLDDKFCPSTYYDLHQPQFDANGEKNISNINLRIYLRYAEIADVDALQQKLTGPGHAIENQMTTQTDSTGQATFGGRFFGIITPYRQIFYFLSILVIGLALGALLFQGNNDNNGNTGAGAPHKPNSAPFIFKGSYIAADDKITPDSFWHRAEFRFYPYSEHKQDSFYVEADSLYRDYTKKFNGLATLANGKLFIELGNSEERNIRCYFIFDGGSFLSMSFYKDKMLGGKFLAVSNSDKVTEGVIVLLGKEYADYKGGLAQIKNYLKGLSYPRSYLTDFPITSGNPSDLPFQQDH